MRRSGVLICAALSLATFAVTRAAEFYVASTGNDSNSGSIEQPFATVQRAQNAASLGDTVCIRGGTYRMTEKQIARRKGIFAVITFLDTTPISPPSGPATGYSNGLHPNSNFLAIE